MNGEVSWETSWLLDTSFPGPFLAMDGSAASAFSLRGAGGGGATFASRLISPDLRGGGGEGGRDPRGDRDGGTAGVDVVERLGDLISAGEALVTTGFTIWSGLRNAEESSSTKGEASFGGDRGGCTVTAGGWGFGTCGFGASDGLFEGIGGGVAAAGSTSWWRRDGATRAGFGRSFGLVGIVGVVGVEGVEEIGAACSCSNFKSFSRSGLGAGEIGLEGGLCCCDASSPGLVMFSKRASKDDTGL